ncbi:hypothetical protein DEU56DRAFT_755426 [Suillus clintonianus]|uniref:uncharacterized protein n=1 Tax=Suillus clintonianus TaxID=1904413 RepID=UPI001B86E879|nr:uncharacterized protein DEU56DRAFT_755426 [Suillus clintonianus]KAG2139651.1 hypothetical protein DEU56DRAFT_755426 [Suillus clintonianus]
MLNRTQGQLGVNSHSLRFSHLWFASIQIQRFCKMSSRSSLPSAISHDHHIQDLRGLLEGMTLSDSSPDTITWSWKTVTESITLSRSHSHSHSHSHLHLHTSHLTDGSPLRKTTSVHSLSPESPPPSQTQSSIVTLPSVPDTQFPFYGVVIEIQAPHAGIDPEGFCVVTVGQEVGIFYIWADVAVRTNSLVDLSGCLRLRPPRPPHQMTCGHRWRTCWVP